MAWRTAADGAPFRITLNPGTARARDVKGKETLTLADGDLVVIETCGRRRLWITR